MNDTLVVVMFGLMVGLILVGTIINTMLTVLLFQDKKDENVRLANIEKYLKELSEEVESSTDDQNDAPFSPTFHSVDGKYHAKTLGELWQMMKEDPKYNIPPDADFTNPEIIKQFLRDINSEIPYEEDDDEEDEKEDWQK